MKVYQAQGATEQDIRQSITFCFIQAWYSYYRNDTWGALHYLSGALHNLDLLTREVGDEYYYPHLKSLT